jgi:hypothetical protein
MVSWKRAELVVLGIYVCGGLTMIEDEAHADDSAKTEPLVSVAQATTPTATPTVVVQATAAAPTAGAAPDEWGSRTLKGHTFPAMVSPNALGAFVTTDFGVRQGFAITSLTLAPSGGAPVTLNLAGLDQKFNLGVKITDWLGVFADGEGQVLLGTNVKSIAIGPNDFSFTGEGGAVLRLFRIESSGTQLALRASGGGGPGIGANVNGLLANLVKNPQGSVENVINGKVGKYLLTPESQVNVTGSLNAAQPLTKNFGLQLTFAFEDLIQSESPFSGTTSVSESTNTPEMNVAFAVSIDGAPSGVPIAFVPEYELTKAFGSAGYVGNNLFAGLYYTGRRDLLVGVSGGTTLGLPDSESLYVAEFLLRYYW